jgi:hypothetical protein
MLPEAKELRTKIQFLPAYYKHFVKIKRVLIQENRVVVNVSERFGA